MPESKGRKKDAYTPPPTKNERKQAVKIGSPRWLAPTMVAMFAIGLIYIVVFYIAGAQIPVMNSLSAIVNIAIGFGFIAVGFFLATKWQ